MARYLWQSGRWFTPFVVAVRSLIGKQALTVTARTQILQRKEGVDVISRSRLLCSASMRATTLADPMTEPSALHCAGCGASIQTKDASLPGFTPKAKIEEWHAQTQKFVEDDAFVSEIEPERDIFQTADPLICQRCFSLKHYNTALNITLKADDYLTHLSVLKEKRALVLLMIDVTDFPASIFPNLNALISKASRVLVIANKVDLLPRETTRKFWIDFEHSILSELRKSSLSDCSVMGVQFISARMELGLEELCDEITYSWGNRGDVYLLGCTNVGKSTLFNKLLTRLCGAKPGELRAEGTPNVPVATISQWPGTTLSLLSFPLLSVGKVKRLMQQKREMERSQELETSFYEDDDLEQLAFDEENILNPREAKRVKPEATDIEDVLEELGIGKRKKQETGESLPLNKYWLHDTPGAINDSQLINLLTTKELKLFLPKKPLRPRTFILKPGQCLFIGGLARLDYARGPDSAYFTVFASSYLPIHTSKISKADRVYENLLGTPQFKIPMREPDDHPSPFPPLLPQEVQLLGESWKKSTADIILSSAGWVSFTIGRGLEATLIAHTPEGKGIAVRTPPLFPLAVNERGKRCRSGNRAEFRGK